MGEATKASSVVISGEGKKVTWSLKQVAMWDNVENQKH